MENISEQTFVQQNKMLILDKCVLTHRGIMRL